MTTSDKRNDQASDARLANAAENDPNYTADVRTVSESEADAAERERNEQLRDEVTGAPGPHYNAHLDADGPGGSTPANVRQDGNDNPTFEERTGLTRDEATGRVTAQDDKTHTREAKK